MLKNMGPFFILGLLLISCGEKKSIRPGSTKSALIESKGAPLRTEVVPAGEVLTYKNNEKFQVRGEKVSTIFKDPTGDEKNVLFWRHAFRDCQTTERTVNDEKVPEVELACKAKGKSVIYVQGTGRVVRVTDYEVQ